jgi:two-component system LytT family response regulator
MKAILVEDEAPARRELRLLLQAHPDVEIVGEASSPKEASRLIATSAPELIFLDVNLRAGTGFDLLESLGGNLPGVIFTTAHADFSLQAFDYNAIDYLLKPINPDRLAKALARFRPIAGGGEDDGKTRPKLTGLLTAESKIFLRGNEKSWYVALSDIFLIEAEGNYSRIHFDRGAVLIHRSLSSVEERLPPEIFFRANRAQLINLRHIAAVEPWFSQTIKVTLQDGRDIEFSRRSSLIFRETNGL